MSLLFVTKLDLPPADDDEVQEAVLSFDTAEERREVPTVSFDTTEEGRKVSTISFTLHEQDDVVSSASAHVQAVDDMRSCTSYIVCDRTVVELTAYTSV